MAGVAVHQLASMQQNRTMQEDQPSESADVTPLALLAQPLPATAQLEFTVNSKLHLQTASLWYLVAVHC